MEYAQIERLFTKQLEHLEEYLAALRDLNRAFPQDVCNETILPQDELLLKLGELTMTATEKLRETLSNTPSVGDPANVVILAAADHKRGAEGDGNAEKADREQQAIKDNAAFMEPLGDVEEYAADLKADDIR
ncbi:hypothetical protein Y032_0002g757 [Ancylostoma ceylanicum]|uniref:Uncharacterized protein n=1 Tax=Ancylostoma ceylanicum TaxID=53326 RepID=A0A016W197_9BILA|nr:hypothetical protein Y032_0002g757 [Ancylostoma ceylanicum]